MSIKFSVLRFTKVDGSTFRETVAYTDGRQLWNYLSDNNSQYEKIEKVNDPMFSGSLDSIVDLSNNS